MSKVKKQTADRSTTISEKDVKFVKSIEFAGWIFLIIIGGFMGIWVIFDFIPDTIEFFQFLNLIDISIDAVTFSFIIFTGGSAPICFGIATKIKKDFKNKKAVFMDWLFAESLFALFAILSIAAYQW